VSSVAGKLDGRSVRDLLEALIAGGARPEGAGRPGPGQAQGQARRLAAALAGRFDDHHAELARMLLDQIDALGGQIGTLSVGIEQLLAAIPAAQGWTPTAPPARVLAAARTRWCGPPPPGWMRSAASGPAPPGSSSPRSGWTWGLPDAWPAGVVAKLSPRTLQSGPAAAPARPARATLPQGRAG
jgi:transposase